MANGLDKLERLFSARKKSASSRATVTADSNITGSPPDIAPSLFPSAPFIRPKCNVMYARDELDIYSQKPFPLPLASSNKKHSLDADSSQSSSSSSQDKNSMADSRRPSSFSTTASFHVPNRSSSLLSRRHNKVPTGLVQLARETSSSSARPLPLRIHKQSSGNINQQIGLLEALPIYPTNFNTTSPQVETPPPSDQDENFNFPSPPKNHQHHHHAPKSSSTSPMISQLTPEPSPDMIPYRALTTSSDLRRESVLSSPPTSKRITASSVPLLDDDWRDSYIHSSANEETKSVNQEDLSNKLLVFDEPHVKEFLSLTDDDLAEIKVTAPSNPPTKRAPPPPILPPNVRNIKPLPLAIPTSRKRRSMAPQSPIVACNEVAAWEAARIAKKYDFDVVYVANFWPSGMNHLHNPQETTTTKRWQEASLPETPRNSMLQHNNSINLHGELSSPVSDCCPNSLHSTNGNATTRPRALTRLHGCLLAGYGLETIQAPFRLSARLHKKILRSEGWIEHRNSEAKENEFARGYARSFYTGTVTATNNNNSLSTKDASSRRASAPDASETYGGKEGARSSNKNSMAGTSKVNRGIVFVAFRRPRPHGGTVHSSQAELNALEREAETLVELILDFHEERRRWEILQEARKYA